MDKYELLHELQHQGILDKKVLQALEKTPREAFIPSELASLAYENTPLPIGEGQTISQPYTVAFMLQLLDLHPGHKVLEIGTGSGYNASLLSHLVGPSGKVITVETLKSLSDRAAPLMPPNVELINADGSQGYPEKAPYDRIIITAAVPQVSKEFIHQLKIGGILVAPVTQTMTKILKNKKNIQISEHGQFSFVPMTGKAGMQ